MTWTARTLCAAYLAAGGWLVHCAFVSNRNGAPWTAVAMAVTASLLTAAFLREFAIGDAEEHAELLLGELRHRTAQDNKIRGWADLDVTCCFTAWKTRGAAHDPANCTRSAESAPPGDRSG